MIDYSNLDVMAALPQSGDVIFVVRESQSPADTEMLPWDVLQTAWIGPAAATPAAITDAGAVSNVQWDSEYLYFRNGTQWQRLPFEASSWGDTYNRLLRPVAPSLASDPVGAPDGHWYYRTADDKFRFKQGGSYVSILTASGAYGSITDGTTTAAANGGAFKIRSNNQSINVTVQNDDPTHGDNVNIEVEPSEIDVGDFNDDGTYSIVGHNHDADYADINHNHAGVYLEDISSQNLGTLADVTITSIAAGELLKWNGTGWINNTLAEAGISAVGHGHAATDVTSGTFADARISQSSVTQHQAAINHDALTGFVANEHIDHSTVSILTASGSGLTGGGNLTASRSLAVNIVDVQETVVIDLALDYFIIHDASAGGIRKVHPSYFGFDVANHSHTAAQITSGVLSAERGALGANAAAFAGIIKMSGGVASVATPNVDYLADTNHNHVYTNITNFQTGVNENTTVVANTAARHTQNTDVGTTSAYFQWLTGTNGGRVYWHDATQEFRLRNFDNSAYAPLRVGELYVEGSVTEIESNQVNIGDNIILLNSDVALNAENSDGGIDIKLLDVDNVTDRTVSFRYNTTSRRWTMSGFTAVTSAPLTKTVAGKHTELVGDGVSQNIPVDHGLNTNAVTVSAVDVATGDAVSVDWQYVNDNRITLKFGPSSIPATNAIRVTVVG